MSRPREACVIVAHPDDETLWAGGTVMRHADHSWTIVTVCRGGDPDRAPRFLRAVERLRARGAMADLDDGPDQKPLDPFETEKTVLSLLPRKDYDLMLTHSPFGEYTRHRRHEETSRAVTRLWEQKKLSTRELWLFAYEDGERQYYPRPVERAHLVVTLDDGSWEEKNHIVQNIYGFSPDSWEAGANARVEAFWRFRDAREYRAWFEKEREYSRGGAR